MISVESQSSREAIVGLASALLCLLLAASAAAEPGDAPNGVLLVAKPGLLDANFSRTVVLVTQTPDSRTVGVILNRPMQTKLSELMPGAAAAKYSDAIYFGGPVMRSVVVAVFRSPAAPVAPEAAFPVARDLYLSLHPANIATLLEGTGQRFRLYAGFSGWAPRQLESELARDGWYVLPAREELLFRDDTAGLWEELVDRAAGARAMHREKNDFQGLFVMLGCQNRKRYTCHHD